MDAFGIDAKILIAIKTDRYSPVEGIKLDNLSKIYKAFEKIERRLDDVCQALNLLVDNTFKKDQAATRTLFKSLITITKIRSQDEDED